MELKWTHTVLIAPEAVAKTTGIFGAANFYEGSDEILERGLVEFRCVHNKPHWVPFNHLIRNGV